MLIISIVWLKRNLKVELLIMDKTRIRRGTNEESLCSIRKARIEKNVRKEGLKQDGHKKRNEKRHWNGAKVN